MRSIVPSQSHNEKQLQAVLFGGSSFGIDCHWQPVEST